MMYWHVSAKPFYLENLFNYSMRIQESVLLCLGKKSQILISIALPTTPFFMSFWGKKVRVVCTFLRYTAIQSNFEDMVTVTLYDLLQ